MASLRLKTIANYIEPYKTIADVGCDHGHLILEAFENHYIDFAQAIDNKSLPLKNALKNITKAGLSSKVIFTLGDGLENLWEGIEVIVISGMGGYNIIKILSNNSNNEAKRFILQANRNVYNLRKYLMENGYRIVDEDIILEDERHYEIVVCERTARVVDYSEKELRFGPVLLKKRSQVLIDKLKQERDKLALIDIKVESIDEKIRRLDEIICSRKK
ncbi:MAG TPA: class I SAM-dependent methyltransferase [Bacilli bacterium]|nr:class I SAM-dependent methyltransferase [Bacilli bacterium]